MLVRILKSWTSPDLLRQTPGGHGRWGDTTFTLEPIPNPDYLVVLNHIPQDTTVTISPTRIWLFVQEPPDSIYRWMEKGFPHFSRIHTQDKRLHGPSIHHTHGSLPWHVSRTYDQLIVETAPPRKTGDLSWITSNLAITPGHRRRLAFLDRLRSAKVPFDLYGRGFNPIPDKYDGLAPYRYALSIEKTVCEHYWSEKLADCFLSWTMPIYYGATKLEKYFPAESFIRIDINDPSTPRRITEIIRSNHAEKHRDAIAEARRRVLEVHNLFPRLVRLISKDLLTPAASARTLTLPHNIDLTRYYIDHGPINRALRSFRRRLLPV